MTSQPDIYVSTQTGLFRATMGARVDGIEPIDLGPVGRVWPIVTDIRIPTGCTRQRRAPASSGPTIAAKPGTKKTPA